MDSREYRVGRFVLKPFRQLLEAGAPVPVGRKALDLLSVLARADGTLVTKDELMAAVWPKSIVEDNAIQVHIAALRKLLGKDAELLSTVHGLGYRLVATPEPVSSTPAPAEAAAEVSSAAMRPRRRWVQPVMWAGLAIIVMAAGLWPLRDRLPWTARPGGARVAVLPFDTSGPGTMTRGFADGLLDAIVGELSDNQIEVVSRTESQALRGAAGGKAIDKLGVDLLLDGTVQSDGKTLDVHLYLDDAGEHVSVWSGEFSGPVRAPEALQASVAAQAADALYWAKTGRSGKVRLDAASLAAFIAGRQSTTGVRNNSSEVAEADYRKVVAVAPDFSWGHSGVAAMEAFELLEAEFPGYVISPRSEALRADVRREAKRALELEPHNGEAWLALELAAPLLDWNAREALLIQGAAADPNFEPGVMMEGRLLAVVGRGRDALPWLWRAHDIDPLHNGETWSLALSLAAEGHQAESEALVAQMGLQWPEHFSTGPARLWTSIITGGVGHALALLADPAARPVGMDQKSTDVWSAALKACTSKDAAVRAAAVKTVTQAAHAGFVSHGVALTLLAMLGDLDGAFAEARLYEPLGPSWPPYLFLPMTAPMRSDPRFMALAHKLGMVAYWRSTGKWPDFCSEPGLPYDCHAEATKVAAWHPVSGPGRAAP